MGSSNQGPMAEPCKLLPIQILILGEGKPKAVAEADILGSGSSKLQYGEVW